MVLVPEPPVTVAVLLGARRLPAVEPARRPKWPPVSPTTPPDVSPRVTFVTGMTGGMVRSIAFALVGISTIPAAPSTAVRTAAAQAVNLRQ